MPSLGDFGLNTSVNPVGDAPTEDRAACLFVKRIAEMRRPARYCFSHVADPLPPPPPPHSTGDREAQLNLRKQRLQLGELEQYESPRRTDRAEWEFESEEALKGTQSLIDSLGENNPILRDLLDGVIEEINSAAVGRRLMQRPQYTTKLTDAAVTHELMKFYPYGIPGVTVGSCEALCEALLTSENSTDTEQCHAFAFVRGAPFSVVDLTGRCFLLQNAGACKINDFAIGLFTRCALDNLTQSISHPS